ncbi:MAG TPA: copper homeostasis protein CutC [Gemmatimonadales bacterium]|nr:copper homeostasis protein CutC [Gemmatimonadales bacterium]
MIIEACVDSVSSALAAEKGGARRIELCDALETGGLTPSAAKIQLCKERLSIPVVVLIRARGGDFLYGDTTTEVMLRDIALAKAFGADGVAVGALLPDGTIDIARTRAMIDAARPMEVVFHRAFDGTPKALEALEALKALGVDRVLTSGQAPTALEGVGMLKQLVEGAAGKITILAGGGINEENAAAIVKGSGVDQLHIRGTTAVASGMTYKRPGFDLTKPLMPDNVRSVTDAGRVRAVVEAVG